MGWLPEGIERTIRGWSVTPINVVDELNRSEAYRRGDGKLNLDADRLTEDYNAKDVDIGRRLFYDHDVPYIVEYLEKFPELTSVSLNLHQIGDEGAIMLSKLTHLRELYLKHNKIGQEGLDALMKMPNLVFLDIEYNNIPVPPMEKGKIFTA
jgi:Leucine-rich repeat (LRR) protein